MLDGAVEVVVDDVEDDEDVDDVPLVFEVDALPVFGFGTVVVVVGLGVAVPAAFSTSCAEASSCCMALMSVSYCPRFPAVNAACAFW